MSHFYGYNDSDGKPELIKSVVTEPQARKWNGIAYASVTSKLGIIKGFIEQWGRGEAIKHANNLPYSQSKFSRFEDYVEHINKMVFRQYTNPINKEVMWSSDFGTRVHNELEQWNLDQSNAFHPDWKMFCDDWVSWLDKNSFEPVWAEKVVICNTLKTAGSVDFIGQDMYGEYFLADYKCRLCPKGKGKWYDKDRDQLAIETFMLKNELQLNYLPRCFSICINCETGDHYPKEWKKSQLIEGIESFAAINMKYNQMNKVQTFSQAIQTLVYIEGEMEKLK